MAPTANPQVGALEELFPRGDRNPMFWLLKARADGLISQQELDGFASELLSKIEQFQISVLAQFFHLMGVANTIQEACRSLRHALKYEAAASLFLGSAPADMTEAAAKYYQYLVRDDRVMWMVTKDGSYRLSGSKGKSGIKIREGVYLHLDSYYLPTHYDT